MYISFVKTILFCDLIFKINFPYEIFVSETPLLLLMEGLY